MSRAGGGVFFSRRKRSRAPLTRLATWKICGKRLRSMAMSRRGDLNKIFREWQYDIYSSLLRTPKCADNIAPLYLCNNSTTTMPTFQWVYSSGCNWIPFETKANREIERLWFNGTCGGWIYLTTFGGNAYVNTASLYLQWCGYNYRIARRLH